VNTPRRLSDSQKPTQKLHQKTTQLPQNTTKPSQPKRTQPTQHHIHIPTPPHTAIFRHFIPTHPTTP
jgi:hypothetical protein